MEVIYLLVSFNYSYIYIYTRHGLLVSEILALSKSLTYTLCSSKWNLFWIIKKENWQLYSLAYNSMVLFIGWKPYPSAEEWHGCHSKNEGCIETDNLKRNYKGIFCKISFMDWLLKNSTIEEIKKSFKLSILLWKFRSLIRLKFHFYSLTWIDLHGINFGLIACLFVWT